MSDTTTVTGDQHNLVNSALVIGHYLDIDVMGTGQTDQPLSIISAAGHFMVSFDEFLRYAADKMYLVCGVVVADRNLTVERQLQLIAQALCDCFGDPR